MFKSWIFETPWANRGNKEAEPFSSVSSIPLPSKSPILISTSSPDEDWVNTSKQVLIFTHQLPKTNRTSIRNKKLEHFQFYFWTALDRARRLNRSLDGSVRLWEYHDLQGMLTWWRICLHAAIPARVGESNVGLWQDVLLSSPWFDCPIFEDLLWEVVTDGNGQPKTYVSGDVMVGLRNPKSAVLEKEFFERWWLMASRLSLRRFENGDAVVPITTEYYRAQYGTASLDWRISQSDSIE
ncbi:hypothetical protein NCS55_00494100 [Fusarium keratoplasticum]|nr:hypothetical protein NCS55_00494100 [Fusarium keratoplasticum]